MSSISINISKKVVVHSLVNCFREVRLVSINDLSDLKKVEVLAILHC